MTALDPASAPDTDGLAALAGLEMAAGQLAPLITVLRAEQARRKAGIAITRPAWKNLVFTGGPGTGKSRAAAAIARLYRDLGVLRYGNLIEIPALDLPGPTPRDTAAQVTEAVKVTGDLVMITGAHAWHDLPGHGQHLLRCLYQLLTEARKFHGDELAVILAGRPARSATCCTPPPRWPPGSPPSSTSPATPPPSSPPSSAPWPPKPDSPSPPTPPAKPPPSWPTPRTPLTGNARLAVQLLTQATTNQAHRVTTSAQPCDPAALAAICVADIPDCMPFPAPPHAISTPASTSDGRPVATASVTSEEAPAVRSLCMSGLDHREPAPELD